LVATLSYRLAQTHPKHRDPPRLYHYRQTSVTDLRFTGSVNPQLQLGEQADHQPEGFA
jgi:hypothetical protein